MGRGEPRVVSDVQPLDGPLALQARLVGDTDPTGDTVKIGDAGESQEGYGDGCSC